MDHDDVARLCRIASNAADLARVQAYRAVQAEMRAASEPHPERHAAAASDALELRRSAALWEARAHHLAEQARTARAASGGGSAPGDDVAPPADLTG